MVECFSGDPFNIVMGDWIMTHKEEKKIKIIYNNFCICQQVSKHSVKKTRSDQSTGVSQKKENDN